MQWTRPARCAAGAFPPVKEAERRMRTRDVALRVSSKCGTVRVVYASTVGLLRETARRHRLAARTHGHRPFLELVGTHLTFTNILAALQEGEERVASRFTADEATVATEALALGECRCHVRDDRNATAEGPPFLLRVDRVLYGQGRPFSSVTAARLDLLVSGDEEGRRADDAVSAGRLGVGDVPRDKLMEYFRHNISLHGYNFFRQSEGSTSALWCCTRLDDLSIERALACCAGDAVAGGPGDSAEADTKLDAAMGHAGVSYGVLVQPLLAGQAVERDVHRLQEALVRASVADPGVFGELSHRATAGGLACQDNLSLLTGDYEGAHVIATAARQFAQDPSIAAPVVERVRRQLGVDEFRLPLDCATLVRNGLDYFCRCSKESFLRSVVGLPEEELARLVHETSFRCTFCGKVHQLRREDWQNLLQNRAK